jgi:hypothetical protein
MRYIDARQIITLGTEEVTAADLLSMLVTVDGALSNLDADYFRGNAPSAFAAAEHNHAGVYQPAGSYEAAGSAAAAVSAHEGASDPHSQYETQDRADARYSALSHTHTGDSYGRIYKKTAYVTPWIIPVSVSAGTQLGGVTLSNINTLILAPIFIPFPVTIDRICIWVTTLKANSFASMGLYSSSDYGLPDNRILQYKNLDTTSTGQKAGIVDITLATGLYWIGIASNNYIAVRSGYKPLYVTDSGYITHAIGYPLSEFNSNTDLPLSLTNHSVECVAFPAVGLRPT